MLFVDLEKTQGSFHLQLRFEMTGGVTALFGRSGAGKTSLVSMMAGLRRPDRGRIVLNDRVLFDSKASVNEPAHRRRIGMVFQDGRLFPHLSVRDNLRYGENMRLLSQRYARLDQVVELLGVAPLLNRMPASLSGGEKQRIAIGRALMSSPDMLLMDEPLAALDGARKAELLPFIRRLSQEYAVPILYISHAMDEVIELADRLIVLEAGREIASGSVEDVLGRQDLSAISGRMDAGTVIRAKIVAHRPELGQSDLALGTRDLLVAPLVDAISPGAIVRLRIPAQEVALALRRPTGISIRNILPAIVRDVSESADGFIDVRVEIDGGNALWTRITKSAQAEMRLEAGNEIFALIKSVALPRSGIADRSAAVDPPRGEGGPSPMRA